LQEKKEKNLYLTYIKIDLNVHKFFVIFLVAMNIIRTFAADFWITHLSNEMINRCKNV